MEFYKKSLFNFAFDYGMELAIYNSFTGLKSICIVSEEKKQKIKSWISSGKTEKVNDPDFDTLIEKGFLVPINTNEINKRNLLYAQYMCDRTLSLVIHTTKECNFRCQYCYLDFRNQFVSGEIKDSIIKFIQKRINQFNSVRISWFGGEPLLGMNTIQEISEKIIPLCAKAKKPYYASVTTNGYLLSPQNIETLIKCKVNSITVTIDGLKETHDKLRFLKNGEGTFDQIISNLSYIRDNVNCSKLRVIIRTNFTRTNARMLEEYYNFYNNYFGNDRRFSLFIRPVRDVGGERVKKISDDLLSNEEMNEIFMKLISIQKKNGISFLSNFSDLEPGGYTCSAMCIGKYTIDADGYVSKCDSVEEGVKIGKLDRQGNLIHFGTNEEDWVAGCFQEKTECEECYFSATCFKGSCPIERIKGGRKKCTTEKNMIETIIRLYLVTKTPTRI